MSISLEELEFFTLRYCGTPPPISYKEEWEALTSENEPIYTMKAALRVWKGAFRGESTIENLLKTPSPMWKLLIQSSEERMINMIRKIAFEGEGL